MAARGANALRIFVGNIAWTIGPTELKAFASKFGPVTASFVPFDKNTGMNRGYGFVVFGNADGYESAIAGGTQILDGNQLNIQPADNFTPRQ
jgi:heterogeneous nuclear ribonucleoprotein A/B/D